MEKYIIEAVVSSIYSAAPGNRFKFSISGACSNYLLKRERHEFNVFWPIEPEKSEDTKGVSEKKKKLPLLMSPEAELYADSLAHLIMNLFQSRSKVQFFVTIAQSKNQEPEICVEKVVWA